MAAGDSIKKQARRPAFICSVLIKKNNAAGAHISAGVIAAIETIDADILLRIGSVNKLVVAI